MDLRDQRIADLESQLALRDGRIAELEGALEAKDARIAQLETRVAQLTEQVAELLRRLGQDSGNSNKPPSSDPPGNRAARRAQNAAKKKGERKRGGQPGHKGTRRALLPPDQVDEVKDYFPDECENCWRPLPKVTDPNAKRYQTTELPPITPHTTEHRRHEVQCPCCKHKTRAAYDPKKIPSSPFGPRLTSIISVLTGAYHLSRRDAAGVLDDLCGVKLSLGAISESEERVSEAVKPAVDEAWAEAKRADVKHTDGTSWYQAGVLKSLWTIATTMVTVFAILDDGKGETLKPLFGKLRGILVSDRATALKFWAMDHRQICWAHLLRKFISFSERDGPAGAFGRELRDYVGVIFANWRELKDGKLSRPEFRERMAPVREHVELALQRAVAAGLQEVSGSCQDILDHREALWTFVRKPGVEPTNNHAEQALRPFVLWRKRSFGTQSERGNVFATRLMTVVETARKQNKHVLDFLTACCIAQREGTPAPSLLAA